MIQVMVLMIIQVMVMLVVMLMQVMVGENMSSRELVWLLLSKYRMRHRDPKVG